MAVTSPRAHSAKQFRLLLWLWWRHLSRSRWTGTKRTGLPLYRLLQSLSFVYQTIYLGWLTARDVRHSAAVWPWHMLGLWALWFGFGLWKGVVPLHTRGGSGR